TLKENIQRTGDPLGFTRNYWSEWAHGLELPKGGDTVLYTARMYQMLPFVLQTTQMVPTVKPFLTVPGVSPLLRAGNRLAGECMIRMMARNEDEIRFQGKKALGGIAKALNSVGIRPGFLYDDEPYSGALLHDLGLEGQILPHVRQVCRTFLDHGVKTIITVDPHTTHMLKLIFPTIVPEFHPEVRHYTELLQERGKSENWTPSDLLPLEFVLHDSCVMTRDLDLVAPIRNLSNQMGFKLNTPENNGKNTACCGGPVEYAFGDLCHQISTIRIRELSQVGRNVITACPICLINLKKYETELGVRIWDMGEVLNQSLPQ
ncbi:MAG: (Fe-S)-binding protein, partial [Desulfobacterales bacterium]|nr:(Fe-S)-binding protein [Desulfobacterales bacterium]